MFFKIMGFLLVVGTLASMMAGVPMPGSPTSNTSVGNLSPGLLTIKTATIIHHNATQFGEGGCLNPWGCAAWDENIGVDTSWFGIPAFIGWITGTIIGGILFGWQIFAFFSGVATFVGGANAFALPEPLNFIFIIGISFAWIFLALETARRIIGLIWGR